MEVECVIYDERVVTADTHPSPILHSTRLKDRRKAVYGGVHGGQFRSAGCGLCVCGGGGGEQAASHYYKMLLTTVCNHFSCFPAPGVRPAVDYPPPPPPHTHSTSQPHCGTHQAWQSGEPVLGFHKARKKRRKKKSRQVSSVPRFM